MNREISLKLEKNPLESHTLHRPYRGIPNSTQPPPSPLLPSCYLLDIKGICFFILQPTQNSDTVIYTINDTRDLSIIYLYRLVGQNKRLYLDLSPQSNTVGPANTSNTTKFRSRNGVKTC